MAHEFSTAKVIAMDASSPVYWVCSCGSASDEEFTTATLAQDHYESVHFA